MPSSRGGSAAEQAASSSPQPPPVTPGWPPPDVVATGSATGHHPAFPGGNFLFEPQPGTYQLQTDSAAQRIRSTTAGSPDSPGRGHHAHLDLLT